MQDVARIPTNTFAARAVSIAVVVIAILIASLGAKWQLGDMLARVTPAAEPNAVIAADDALRLAPADPQASSLRAEIGNDPSSEDTRTAVEIAEQTVRLSPFDCRWRTALARNLADEGRILDAEEQFKRAIELAPTYADVRWYYGNFLLRQGRGDEAVGQFKIAAADDPEYRRQVLALVWDYSVHDAAVLESVAGEGVDNISQLTFFLASHGRGSDAVRNWNRLTEVEKATRSNIALNIAQGLIDQHMYRSALEFSRQIGADTYSRVEAITNGSFETSIDAGADSHFNWRISRNDPKLEIATDDKVRHERTRSLRMTFRGTAKPNLFNAVQTVAVVPGAKYRLTFWLRTENLKAPAGPLVDVSTGDESTNLGRTQPFANGTNDWRLMTIDLNIPADADGIEIRTVRQPCGGDDCPISGIVWYDDFILTRL
jgi:tetratricopeptide (TPR) repeat protein